MRWTASEPRFEISYRHSVARLPAIEYFRVGPGDTLELYKTAYQGLGAGLPFGEEGGTVRLQDGWIVIEGLQRRFPSVTLSPMPLTEHRLRIGGREVDLAALSAAAARSPCASSANPWSVDLCSAGGWGISNRDQGTRACNRTTSPTAPLWTVTGRKSAKSWRRWTRSPRTASCRGGRRS